MGKLVSVRTNARAVAGGRRRTRCCHAAGRLVVVCRDHVLTPVAGVPQGTSGPDPTTVYVDMRALRHDR